MTRGTRLMGAVLRLLQEERGFLISSAIRLLLAFSLLGLGINEVGQILTAKIRAEKSAGDAAQAGADAWVETHDMIKARASADRAAAHDDPTAKITAFQVGARGVVTVQAHTTAHTLIVQRIGFLEHFAVQDAQQQGSHIP